MLHLKVTGNHTQLETKYVHVLFDAVRNEDKKEMKRKEKKAVTQKI